MRKYFLLILSLLFIGINNIYSQSIEEIIKNIRIKYSKINNDLNNYDKFDFLDVGLFKDISPNRYSKEGSKLYRLAIINCVKYTMNDSVRKIILTFDCESEFQTSEYYIWNNKLFFVFKSRTQYLKPRWADDFKEKDKHIIENRYYINENKIIRWLDENKKEIKNKDIIESEQELIMHDYNIYLTINKDDIGPAAKIKK